MPKIMSWYASNLGSVARDRKRAFYVPVIIPPLVSILTDLRLDQTCLTKGHFCEHPDRVTERVFNDCTAEKAKHIVSASGKTNGSTNERPPDHTTIRFIVVNAKSRLGGNISGGTAPRGYHGPNVWTPMQS